MVSNMDATKAIPEAQSTSYDGSYPAEQHSDTLSVQEKQPMQLGSIDDFPDGGLRAWLIALATSVVMFSTMGSMNSWGVFQAYYQTHQLADESPSAISWIGSIQMFFLFSSGLVGGPLFDRFGAKVMHPAMILYVFSYMMTSLCTKYWQFMLAQGLLNGVANGLTMAPSMAVTAQYFKKNRGAAMGLTIAGSSIGGLVLPIILAKMLYGPLGFAWTVRIIGFIFLGLLAFAGAVIRARLPPRASKFLLPAAFRNKAYSMMIAACWLSLMGAFVPNVYLPIYAQMHGMDAQLAAYLIAILNGASVFGRVIPGILSDKIGRLNVFSAASVSAGILIFCWPQTSTNADIIVFTAIFGFCSGGVVSGMTVSFASFAASPQDVGTYLGMGMSIISIATLISPPINGAFVEHYHEFNQAAYFSGSMALAGGFLAFSIKFILPGGFAVRS